MMRMPGLSKRGGGVGWSPAGLRGEAGIRAGGLARCHLAAYSGLLRARGGCAPFPPCSVGRYLGWWDWRRVGLENAVGSLLAGVPQRGICRRWHGRPHAVSFEVEKFLHCFLGAGGPG